MLLDFTQFNSSETRCVGIGEILFDVFNDQSTLGGAPANFAYHMHENGFNSTVISAVGQDEYADLACAELDKHDLDFYLQDTDYATGRVDIVLDDDGVANYNFDTDCAYDHLILDNHLHALAKQCHIACFGTLARRSAVSNQSIVQFLQSMPPSKRLRIFDVNLRQNYYSSENIIQGITNAEIVKCNEEELPILCSFAYIDEVSSDNFYEFLRSVDVHGLIVTYGANGSEVFINGKKSRRASLKVKKLVDTVGAGDAFLANLIARLIKGDSLSKAHMKANHAAAFVCKHVGAMPDMQKLLV